MEGLKERPRVEPLSVAAGQRQRVKLRAPAAVPGRKRGAGAGGAAAGVAAAAGGARGWGYNIRWGMPGSARSASRKTAGLKAAATEIAAEPTWVFLPVLTHLPTCQSHLPCAERGERVGTAPCPTAWPGEVPALGHGGGLCGARCPWCMLPAVHSAHGARCLRCMVPAVHAAHGARCLRYMVPMVHTACSAWCPRCTLPMVHSVRGARCPEPRSPGSNGGADKRVGAAA